MQSTTDPIQKSILPPNILHISFRQPLIISKLLLPLYKSTLQNINLLVMALLRSNSALARPRIAQRSRRAALLAEGAMKDDSFFVLEGAHEFGDA